MIRAIIHAQPYFGLVWLENNVLSLLIDHLRLTMMCVHYGHIVAVTDLRSIALLRPNCVRAIRRKSMILLVLRWTLACDQSTVHGNAHMPLVSGGVR
jgi:hypothetical protein